MTELDRAIDRLDIEVSGAETTGHFLVRVDTADVRMALNALAAGSGTGETNEDSARCEASQSGGEAVTPERNPR